MRTVIIEITAPPRKGAAIPVRLLSSDGPADAKPTTVANGKIAANFAPQNAVEFPKGQALTVARAQELYAKDEDVSKGYAAIGEFLFELIASGDIADKWRRLRNSAPAVATGEPAVRTILDIEQPKKPNDALDTLRALPWELLYDPVERSNIFLGQPFFRGNLKLKPANGSWPLRVLVVFGAPPEDQEPEDTKFSFTSELHALEKLFARYRYDVEFELLTRPPLGEIEDACRNAQPHVLHFIGHGRAATQNDDACLLIDPPPEAKARGEVLVSWYESDIRNRLKSIAPRLAFLNACRTSEGITNTELSPIATISDAFLAVGSLGVVGMQGDVPTNMANVFSTTFYEALLAGKAIDVAVAIARGEMSKLGENSASRKAWSFPVLRMVVAPQCVLPTHSVIDGTQWPVKRIVSRVAQRHRVREAARVADAAATVLDAKAPIVVIIGEQDSGKSHLAKWCGQLCAANRMRNVHIDIGKSKSAIDLLDVLRYVRDGRLTLPGARSVRDPNWPLPTEAFKYFTRHLALRLRGRDVNSLAGQPLDFDDVAIRLADSKWPEENMVTNTMQDFRGALTDAVANQPTLLTFDHLENLDDTTLNQWLSDELFLPIANGAIPGLRLLLVVPRKTFEDKLSRLRLMNPAPVKVEVGYFKRSDFEALARFLCRQFSETTLETLQPTFAKILKARGGIDGVGYRADVLKAIEALCCALELP